MFSIPFDQDLLQTSVDQIGNQWAVVTAHSFDALAIHLVVRVGSREVQASVTLFVYEQIRKVHLKKETEVKSNRL